METLKLLKKGNFVGDENTDSSGVLCFGCGEENIVGTTFCRCGVKQKKLTGHRRRKPEATLEDGFTKIRDCEGTLMDSSLINNCLEKREISERMNGAKT